MKKLFFTLLVAMIGVTLSANNQSLKLVKNERVVTTASAMEMEIAAELIDGVWTKQSDDKKLITTLQFNDAGLVGILSTATAEVAEFAHKYWHLEGFTENVYLILTDLEQDASETFLIEKVATGIALTDTETGRVLSLNHASAKEVTKLREMQQSLAGEWRSAIHYLSDNKENRKITFHYNLKADGTFERNVERFGYQVRSEKGYWQVSPTGEYLVLHFEDKRDTFITKLAKIKYLAFDELVVNTCYTDAELAKEMKDKVNTLFFNKI